MRLIQTSVALLLLLSLGFSAMVEEYGVASYYDDSFQGRKTASGQPYDKTRLTAAHKSLKFGTIIKVTRLDNKKSVRVRVNDRGPYIKGRIVDLSRKAAEQIGIVQSGHAEVKVEVLGEGTLDEDTPAVVATPKPAEPKPEPPKVQPEKIPESYSSGPTKTESTVVDAVKKTNVKPKPVVKKATPAPAVASTPKELTAKTVTGRDFQQYDLYKVQLLRPSRTGFGIQVASMSQYENVMKHVAELQEKWFKNVLVSVEKGKNNTPDYKIILGPFPDRDTAESYKKQLKKKKKITGFVVDLSAIDYN